MCHPPQSLPSLATAYFELTVPYRLIVVIVVIAYHDDTTSTAVHLFKAGGFFSDIRCLSMPSHVEYSCWCCVNGTRVASKLPPYPPDFQRWIDNTTLPLSAISRRLNYLFAFSAIGASEGFVHFGVPADVVVSGRVYHRLLDLSAGDHSMRWFLYDEDARSLKAANANVPLPAVQQTKHLIQSVNPYLSTIRHALQQVADEAIPLAVELKDSSLSGEVAAVINTQNLGTIDCRKVVFHRHGGRAHFVHILSRHYEPLQYPLLFPHGTLGWGIPALDEPTLRRSGTTGNDTPAQQANGLTQLQWYRALLLSEARFLTFGRLACEYLVDMYSRIEETNLDYLRRARSMQSSGLDEQTAEISSDSLRNRLPATFTGSRAWTSDQVADSLALARHFGKPTFFITMTTNPGWPEIVSSMKASQHFTDIPTVVCRAFHIRLQHLKSFIKAHFGRMLYVITVVEFQKRGLPHAHMLIKSPLLMPWTMSFPLNSLGLLRMLPSVPSFFAPTYTGEPIYQVPLIVTGVAGVDSDSLISFVNEHRSILKVVFTFVAD
ncbi:hypothetical protein CABS01_16959 [Colletotrichum abscissum]|uniref:uncharacterized protein n=1 Tax=Colletotrichum abscissum TaxID=1671311 RepID=UPI0027D734B6|nr:uncharacterized protein CABS01_16959 [Colletotrichum abscissum]KAK1502270.1 hypothetical protein CABS01_16959 [Colletotrichum abscissum]